MAIPSTTATGTTWSLTTTSSSTTARADNFSTSVWKEFKYLYKDLAHAVIPYTSWNPLTTSEDDQNAAAEALFAQPNELGIYWAAFDGGNHMATWIYSHRVSAAYEWLLSQTRDSEMARDKLDLNKPFEKAAVQLRSDRAIAGGTAYLTDGPIWRRNSLLQLGLVWQGRKYSDTAPGLVASAGRCR